MEIKKYFFSNIISIFIAILVFFSFFIARTSWEFNLLMLLFSTIVFVLYAIAIDSYSSAKKRIFRMPYYLFFYFIIGLFLSIRLFFDNLNTDIDYMKMKGISLSFHLFIAVLAAIFSWYKQEFIRKP